MTRYIMMAALALGLTSFAPLYADGAGTTKKAECSCDKNCSEKCSEGKGEKECKCKACDCKKDGKCPHGKCHHKDHDHKE